MQVKKILETCLYSTNLQKSKKFYSEILGLVLHSEVNERHLFFRCGTSMLMIFNPRATIAEKQKVPSHGSQGPGHIAFSVSDREFQEWKDYLRIRKIDIETQIEWPAGGKSIYFRDPSGNSIELATPEIWQLK